MTSSIDSTLLIVSYILLISFNVIGVVLYNQAYYKMHKTKMIQSVYYLLIAMLVENLYFGFTALMQFTNPAFGAVLLSPTFWAIPKLVLLASLIYFINASISPSKYEEETCASCPYLYSCPNPKNDYLKLKKVAKSSKHN